MGEEQNVFEKIRFRHLGCMWKNIKGHLIHMPNFHLKVGDFTAFFSQVKHPPVTLPDIHN